MHEFIIQINEQVKAAEKVWNMASGATTESTAASCGVSVSRMVNQSR